ncbi:MAG: hypothetical protein NTW40_14610 [Acidobacteria bacterium]|nr:hypothetical protein [Acidobacteriota bacterium]
MNPSSSHTSTPLRDAPPAVVLVHYGAPDATRRCVATLAGQPWRAFILP